MRNSSLFAAIVVIFLLFNTTDALLAQQKMANSGKNCPDLILKDITISKISKKKATIHFVVTNIGDTTAFLHGKSKKPFDNVALKCYLSTDAAYNRGDINVGGSFLIHKQGGDEGLLAAGESFKGTAIISLSSKTSFTPYLVLNLDALQTVIECNETNNTASTVL